VSGSPENDPAEAQLLEQVKALGELFLIRTAGQVVTLREHLARLRQGERDALTAIQELTHKIHGSGAMFGFAALSECAGEIECLTLAEMDAPVNSLDEPAERLGILIEQLARALDATQAQG
jgi:chemotaxis protein histidine kinase CheA